jgi:asparagine synthetase B (glutamine-hydrolysing)
MCGIAGIHRWQGDREEDAAIVARMLSALERRGPDGTGSNATARSFSAIAASRSSI